MPAKITKFVVTPISVVLGASVQFEWEVKDAGATTTLEIEGVQSGLPVPSGSIPVTPVAAGSLLYKLVLKDTADPSIDEHEIIRVLVKPASGGGGSGGPGKGGAKPLPAITGTAPPVTLEDIPTFSPNAVTADLDEIKTASHPDRKRLRLTYHLFAIPNVTHSEVVKSVRLRTLRWVRRVYASANIAPTILSISSNALAAPVPNMLSVTNWQGKYKNPPSGKTAGNAQSIIVIEFEPGGPDLRVTVNLTADDTPLQIANAIKAAVEARENPPGSGTKPFVATMLKVPKCAEEGRTIESVDLLFTKAADGSPAPLKRVTDTDKEGLCKNSVLQAPGLKFIAATGVLEAYENPDAAAADWNMSGNDGLPGGDPPQRQVLYCDRAEVDDPNAASIHIYVVPRGELAGRAYPGYFSGEITDPDYNLSVRLKNAVTMSYAAPVERKATVRPIDGTDTSPFTLPHEICHVLAQTGHHNGEGDVMAGSMWPLTPTDSGAVKGVPDTNGVNAAKHIFSHTLLVGSEKLSNNQSGAHDYRTAQDMMNDMLVRGAHLLAPW